MHHPTLDDESQPNPVDLYALVPASMTCIPEALRAWPQWVCWAYDEAHCCQAVSTPGDLEPTYKKCLTESCGLGFLLTDKDLFSVVHIPNYVDQDRQQTKIIAMEIMAQLNTYSATDDTGDGLDVIVMASGEVNMQVDGLELWTTDHLIPITGNQVGSQSDVQSRKQELHAVVDTFFILTWLQRVERWQGTGTEFEILTHVLEECLNGSNWLQDAHRTGLYPFLATCWQYPDLRLMVASRPFMATKTMKDIEEAIKPYLPKTKKADASRNGVSANGTHFPDDDGQPQYFLGAKNKVLDIQANYEIAFDQDEHWRGRFAYNAFSHTTELDGRAITDHDRNIISSWMSHTFQFSGKSKNPRDPAIDVISQKYAYDPLNDYLGNLSNAVSQEELDRFYISYGGSADTPAMRWIGRTTLVAMIARALEPGSYNRYVPILDGEQNIGKSKLVRELGGPYFRILDMNFDSKEAFMLMKGAWVLEIAELSSFRKTDLDSIKSFVSSPVDSYVPKWANDPVDQPRRCIFIGTVNGKVKPYLIDESGDTRWFPVDVKYADYESLRLRRDRLLAAAKAYYEAHLDDWWYLPREIDDEFNELRGGKKQENSYEEKIAEWIFPKNVVTWRMIAEECLEIPNSQWNSRAIQLEVAAALRGLGWVMDRTKKVNSYGARVYPWVPAKKPQG